MSDTTKPSRSDNDFFHWVHLLRFLAAISVLVWHYQHFYYLRPAELSWNGIKTQPLWSVFSPFYRYGYSAVQFFWMLSGFVFANVYIRANNMTSTGDFVWNRIARLYPLHLLTLVVVALLQIVSMRLLGQYQIYPYNDLYHFVLNVFMASHWGLQDGYSFNGPIWSVSIEVLIYAVFLLILRPLRRSAHLAFIPVFLFGIAYFSTTWATDFLKCGLFFFLGCSIFLILSGPFRHRRFFLPAAGLSLLGASIVAWKILSIKTPSVAIDLTSLIAFSGILIMAVVAERHDRWGIGERTQILGDLSYGCYLWHVPIQICVLMAFALSSHDKAVLSSPMFLLGFLAATISVAFLSFRFFEAPSRQGLKAWRRSTISRRVPATPSRDQVELTASAMTSAASPHSRDQ